MRLNALERRLLARPGLPPRLLRRLDADRPPPPPAVPRGWATGAPDFVGVGASRSAGTWWWMLVVDHPGVASAPTAKELHFFDSRLGGALGAGEIELYRSYFPRPPGAIAGEWTPRYMLDPETPELLRQAAPEAMLLVILRDPVERFLSGLAAERARDHGGVRTGGWIRRWSRLIWNAGLARGLYWAQLSRLLGCFPRERILVLQMERCVAEPVAELRRTYRFLGLEPEDHVPEGISDQVKRSPPQPDPGPEIRARLTAALADDVNALARGFPEIDIELWPNFRHLAGAEAASPPASASAYHHLPSSTAMP